MCRSTFNVRTPFIGRKLLKLLLYISCLSQMEIYNHRLTILCILNSDCRISLYLWQIWSLVLDMCCIFTFNFDIVGCLGIVFPWCYSIWTFITLWKCKQTICMNYTFGILLTTFAVIWILYFLLVLRGGGGIALCIFWRKKQSYNIDQFLWQDCVKKWVRSKKLLWEVGRRKKFGSLSWLRWKLTHSPVSSHRRRGFPTPHYMEFQNGQKAKNSPTWRNSPKWPKMYQKGPKIGHKQPKRPKFLILVQRTQKRPKIVWL